MTLTYRCPLHGALNTGEHSHDDFSFVRLATWSGSLRCETVCTFLGLKPRDVKEGMRFLSEAPNPGRGPPPVTKPRVCHTKNPACHAA